MKRQSAKNIGKWLNLVEDYVIWNLLRGKNFSEVTGFSDIYDARHALSSADPDFERINIPGIGSAIK